MNTIFLATVIGWYMLIMSVFILCRAEQFKSVITDILGHRGSFFILTLLTFLIGLILVIGHNHWVNHWSVSITIFAWILFIGAIFRMFFADHVIKKGKAYVKNNSGLQIPGILFLLFGLYLLYHVYYPSM